MANWNKVGTLLKAKSGKLYIKVEADVKLNSGDSLMLQEPRANLDEAVKSGKLSQEKADEIKGKIPEFVKYNVFQVG